MAKFYKIDDINQIDLGALVQMLPGGRSSWNPLNPTTQVRYVAAILRSYKTLQRYNINTPLRIAHFLGQGLIETGFLRYAEENLNYSAAGLRATFPSRVTEEEAKRLARKPEAIANHVYARPELGNTSPGDGWKYRGRGFFQLTGKDNYRRYGEIAGIDLVNNPDIISKDLKISVQVAAAYFDKVNLGQYADRNDAAAVSRGVNRGNPESRYKAHGEADRVAWTNKVLSLFDNPETILVADGEAGEGIPSAKAGLQAGSSGPEVKDLQEKLNQLGYPAGTPDGIFGRKTAQAVNLFQLDYGLEPTGIADDETLGALDEAVASDTGGNVDIYRDAEGEGEVRRKVGANDNMGAGGAVAGAGGAAGVAHETGTLDEIIEQGTEIYNDITGRAEEAAPEEPPVEEAPVEEPPVEEPPVEEAPEEVPPIDEAPVDEVPVEDVPVEEPPAEEPVVEEAPVEEPPVEEAPVIEDPVEMPPAEEPAEDMAAETTTGTEVPAPMPEAAPPEKDWTMIIIFSIVVLVGLYIIFRARRRREMAEDIYRSGMR